MRTFIRTANSVAIRTHAFGKRFASLAWRLSIVRLDHAGTSKKQEQDDRPYCCAPSDALKPVHVR